MTSPQGEDPKRLTQAELRTAVVKAADVLDGEPEITVRVKGGHEALKAALQAAGVPAYEIIHRHPPGMSYDFPGATGTPLFTKLSDGIAGQRP